MPCWPRCCRSVGDKDQLRAKDSAVSNDSGSAQPEEAFQDWQIGGKYKVLQSTTLWTLPKILSNRVCDLFSQDLVSVIQIETVSDGASRSSRWALVVPPQRELGAGWMLLDGALGKAPLAKRRSAGSWDVPGRYHARHYALLRASPSLSSKEIAEIKPGEEVLVVKLGLNPSEEHEPVRVRAQVKTERGDIGWLSLENSSGTALLDATNLLSTHAVDVHARSLHAELHGTWTPATPSIRRSWKTSIGDFPWEVGGVYRVLEEIPLEENAGVTRRNKRCLLASTLVEVQDLTSHPCDDLGSCPFAKVIVQEGEHEGKEGWLRCADKDGRDLIDIRDQHEHYRVLNEISAKPNSPQSSPVKPKGRRSGPANADNLLTICQSAAKTGVNELPSSWLATDVGGSPLATYELGGEEDRPIDPDPSEQIDDGLTCGHCVCRVLPSDTHHPTVWTAHKTPHPLPVAASTLKVQPLSTSDFERWVHGVFASFDPSNAEQVPELLSKYQGAEPDLVRSLCRRYKVRPPQAWHRVASEEYVL